MYRKITAVLLCLVVFFTMTGFSQVKENSSAGETELSTEEQIEQSEFLYPARNADFRYNKYTYYVEISQCMSLKSNIVIPDTIDNLPVYMICDGAFEDQTMVKSVSISNNVVSIGENAFRNCPGLVSVKLPDALASADECTFRDCTSLRSIRIPNTLAEIPQEMCCGCEKLSYVIIDERELLEVDGETGMETYTPVRTVKNGAFGKCPQLSYVWIPEDAVFEGSDPFGGSLDNLNIYGYSQSDAARYAAENFCDFTLVQNSSSLAGFIGTASTSSMVQTVEPGNAFRGDEAEIQIENVYVFRNAFEYSVSYEQGKELKTEKLSYTPSAGTSVVVLGIRVRNNTSKKISFSNLESDISVDSYPSRFADFGFLRNDTVSKYRNPSYTEIEAGDTQYIYLASVIENDWEEIDIGLGCLDELNNLRFIARNDDSVVYAGSRASIDVEEKNPVQGNEQDENGMYQSLTATCSY